MEYSAQDRDLAIRTIIGEEGSLAGQAGVAAVILNRMARGTYGDTLGDVVLAPGQFEPWQRNPGELLRIQPSDPRYARAGQILDAVNSGQIPDPTNGATHFYAPKAQKALGREPPSWASGEGVPLGDTMFYAPGGATRRTPNRSDIALAAGSERTLTSGLERVGTEHLLTAEGERRQAGAGTVSPAPATGQVWKPDRPPAFTQSGTTGAVRQDFMSRPPAFTAGGGGGTGGALSEITGHSLDTLKQVAKQGPEIVGDAFRENIGAAFGAGQENVARGVAGLKSGDPSKFLPGLTADIIGSVQEAVSPLTGAAMAGMDIFSMGDPMMAGVEAPHVARTVEDVTASKPVEIVRPGEPAPGAAGPSAPQVQPTVEPPLEAKGAELPLRPVQRDVARRAQPINPGEIEFVRNADGSFSMRRADGTTEPVRPPAFTQKAAEAQADAAWTPEMEAEMAGMAKSASEQSVGAAASPAGAPLPDTPTRAAIWEQEDNFNRLRKSVDADRSELMNRVDAMPPEVRNPQTQERFYRHMEDPGFPLASEEQRLYDEHIAPLKREERDLWEEAKKTDLHGIGDYDPTYAHRVVKGRSPQFDRLLGAGDTDAQGPIGGKRTLPQSTSSMKERVYFAMQNELGERRVTARNEDGGWSVLDKGVYDPLRINTPIEVGDAFHYDGHIWTMEQARAHEITAAGGPEYYENAVANTIDNVVRLRQVVRAIHELGRLKSSPEWAAYARPYGAKDIPHDWVEPKMPLFRGWLVHPRLAATIDDFYGAEGSLFDRLAKINRIAVGTMFWSPVRHIYNVGTHWVTARGWDNVTPAGMHSFAADGFRAVQEVIGQGPKYQALLREGNGLIYSSVANHDFYRKMLKRLGEDVVRNPARWDPVARTLGVGPSDLIRLIYQGSSRVLWSVSDMMMMQRVLELERKGMTLREAIQETERHIPPYRTHSEILGSRLASQIYFNPALTEFSRYHYGAMNSWANITKDLVLGGKNPIGGSRRIEAIGNLMATAAILTFVAPIVNLGFQQIFGPKVRVTPAGSMTLPTPFVDKAMHTEWAKEHLPKYILDYYNGDASFVMTAQNLFALAPITRAGLEAVTNLDFFTGRHIYEPSDVEHGRAGRVAGQVAEHVAEKAVQPYYAYARMRNQGKDILKGTTEQALGLSEPNLAGMAKVRHYQDREAQRRAARPRGLLEEIFGKLPF